MKSQARRVGSVEGGSFIFWEVFFSTRDANMSTEGASEYLGGSGGMPPPPPPRKFCKFRFSLVPFPAF